MSANINLLVPAAREKCLEFMKRLVSSGIKAKVTNTLRTPEEHVAIYAQGRATLEAVNVLRARLGWAPITEKENVEVSWSKNSPHLRGIAWDIVVLDAKGKADWVSPDYARAGEIAQSMGLEWGGAWPHKKDAAHFQLPE